MNPDPNLQTCLAQAAYRGDLKECRRLLAQGADPNEGGPSFPLPLNVAAERGSPAVVSALLKGGAIPNLRDAHEKQTPLHHALARGHVRMTATLLNAGADPNALDGNGHTPLHYAVTAKSPKPAIVSALLDAGADPNLRSGALSDPGDEFSDDKFPVPPLLSTNRADIASLLLNAGADPNVEARVHCPPPNTFSALLEAVYYRNADLAAVLLAAGADPELYSFEGKTAHDYAREFCDDALLGVFAHHRSVQLQERLAQVPVEATDRFVHSETAGITQPFVKDEALASHLTTLPAAPHASSPSTPSMVIGGAVWNARDAVQPQPADVQQAPRQRMRL